MSKWTIKRIVIAVTLLVVSCVLVSGQSQGVRYGGPTNFFLELCNNRVPRVTSEHKFGAHPNFDTSTTADVWEFGVTSGAETYTFPSSEETLYVSSSDTNDGATVTIIGLDADWLAQTATAELNGFAPVQVTGSWIRVNRMYNADQAATAGDVYLANTGTGTEANDGVPTSATTVRAYFTAERQQTEQSIYSVAANKTAHITKFRASAGKNRLQRLSS